MLGIMFSTPAKDMYYFSPQEVVKYGINRTGETQVASVQPVQPNSGNVTTPSHVSPAQAPQQAARPSDANANPQQQHNAPSAMPAMNDENKAMNLPPS